MVILRLGFSALKSNQHRVVKTPGLEELNDNVADLDIAEQMEQDGNLLDAVFTLQKLESVVANPIEFSCVFKKIRNKMDVNFVDLEGLYPVEIIEVVTISALSTIGKAFTEDVLYKIVQACNKVLALDSTKKKVLDFIKNRMGCLAPNLIVVFGSVVSVKFVGAARSLLSLEIMSCDDIELLGTNLRIYHYSLPWNLIILVR
ncbi:hypothetical protein FXO37_05071 [Capsicum annuum]|nr:hypothetical protein FXO37_05071 [Capsicum annuum]